MVTPTVRLPAGATADDTYGSCTSCADQVEPVNLTFQVDMNQYAEGYAYGGVFVNGSFNEAGVAVATP